MQAPLVRLTAAAERGLSVAWCVVVSAEGGTSAKPGTAFVSDGASLLSGTAASREQRELLAAVQEALRSHSPLFVEIATENRFDSRSEEGTGRMTILVDPVLTTEDAEYYEQYLRLLRAGRGITEAIALPGSEHAGHRGLFARDGRLLATRTESPTARLVPSLRPLEQHARPYREGSAAYLPFPPRIRLLIAGGGSVAEEVCRLAARVEFDVTVIDDTPELVAASRFPDARERLAGLLADALAALPLDRETFAIVVRQKYQPDLEALKRLAGRGLGYLGMIGNQHKVGSILADLRSSGVPEEAIEEIRAPLGLPIGSRSVPEIAISVVAELIATRNLGGRGSDPPTE